MHLLLVTVVLVFAVLASSCGDDDGDAAPDRSTPAAGGDELPRFPTIVDVEPTRAADGTHDFAVTISSPYDSPARYANGWRVLTPGGDVLAEHELAHDHANEQPFTREQTGVEVPGAVTEVLVEPRDLANGYGGKRVRVRLP